MWSGMSQAQLERRQSGGGKKSQAKYVKVFLSRAYLICRHHVTVRPHCYSAHECIIITMYALADVLF